MRERHAAIQLRKCGVFEIGEFADANVDPQGNVVSEAEWNANRDEWLPTTADGDFIASLMEPSWEPGKFARWIAPPKIGIDNKPLEMSMLQFNAYVRLNYKVGDQIKLNVVRNGKRLDIPIKLTSRIRR